MTQRRHQETTHSVVDGFSRLAYTEHLPDETAATTIGFFHRARGFFAAHGIARITRVVTDNEPNHRASAFACPRVRGRGIRDG